MKKLLITLLTSICSISAFSQESDNSCGRPEQAVQLMRDYGETVVFRGSRSIGEGSNTSITVVLISMNSSTGSWSLFEAQDNGLICLIAKGTGGKIPRPALTV